MSTLKTVSCVYFFFFLSYPPNPIDTHPDNRIYLTLSIFDYEIFVQQRPLRIRSRKFLDRVTSERQWNTVFAEEEKSPNTQVKELNDKGHNVSEI